MSKIKLFNEFIICEDCGGKEKLLRKPEKQIIAFKKLHKKCGISKNVEPDNRCHCETPKLIGKPFTNYEGNQMDFCQTCKHNRLL